MVRIAVAGGSGQLAHGVVDALLAANKHEIIVLSRNEPTPDKVVPGTSWAKVDYRDKTTLTQTLQGVHTVLSFIVVTADIGSVAQKTLIDAAIAAGVKRFAPSEWSMAGLDGADWYAEKGHVRDYLKEVNKAKKILEYTLFQPGIFMEYLAAPYKVSENVTPLQIQVDFKNQRAIVIDGVDPAVTFTSVDDIAAVVSRAVDHEGEWPIIGGIRGSVIKISSLIALGEKIKGKKFDIERLKLEDLEAGKLLSSWYPRLTHPSLSAEEIESMSSGVFSGIMATQARGCWMISDEWNVLLPDFKFANVEEFLTTFWTGK